MKLIYLFIMNSGSKIEPPGLNVYVHEWTMDKATHSLGMNMLVH